MPVRVLSRARYSGDPEAEHPASSGDKDSSAHLLLQGDPFCDRSDNRIRAALDGATDKESEELLRAVMKESMIAIH